MQSKIILSVLVLSFSAFMQAKQLNSGVSSIANESLEIFLTNTNYVEDNYTKARGIYVGLSVPVLVSDTGRTSMAIDGAYANLGTVKGETELGNPNSVRATSYLVGIRGNYKIIDNVSSYVKANVAQVNLDSSALGDSSDVEMQVGLGIEVFILPIGAAVNLSYMNLTGDMDLLMFGVSFR